MLCKLWELKLNCNITSNSPVFKNSYNFHKILPKFDPKIINLKISKNSFNFKKILFLKAILVYFWRNLGLKLCLNLANRNKFYLFAKILFFNALLLYRVMQAIIIAVTKHCIYMLQHIYTVLTV